MKFSAWQGMPDRVIRTVRSVRTFLHLYWTRSYSQEGEDLILRRIFESQSAGFYVDVGAHHPMRYSNTYFFYKRRWRGINIEPNPDSARLFHKYRRRDINVQCGVSDQDGQLKYYMFNDSALNSFDENLSHQRDVGVYRITETCDIAVRRLESILDELLPRDVAIDFMSVDVEGRDLQVLQSNNWERYRPRVLLVEAMSFDLATVEGEPIHRFLTNNSYRLFAKTGHTLFYGDMRMSDGSSGNSHAVRIGKG